MSIPNDYTERVYAGVLGKMIGVYLGRPFEGWSYERIMAELGEIWYYVHEKCGTPLIVTDDDLAGTFTFLRALPDYGNSLELSPAQIGQTWLNYIIENRTILWWGGMGNSTEHTAFLRLKSGISAPQSGSMALNGKVVSEQIGSQIFIDGWAMAVPGDPELAAELARKAASVSHDGEAIYGAQVLAAMEAHAFIESDLTKLLDSATSFIPSDSIIYRAIHDVREWHAAYPDWRAARQHIVTHYGYDSYGGNCHMIPNHALIIMSLLYGDDDFQKTQMIVNTSGWDTDCNAGNVGCLMGIKNGLSGIDAGPDWRAPVADRVYLSAADGGRAITDAVRETYEIVNVGRALQGEAALAPKNGARFHFELPGSVQGFQCEKSPESLDTVVVENIIGHSRIGTRSLALTYHALARGRSGRVATPTFIPPEAIEMPGYALLASPTLYSGQTVQAEVQADDANSSPIHIRVYYRCYGADDALDIVSGPETTLAPGCSHEFTWTLPDTQGAPIAEIGMELSSDQRADGTVYLDYLTWSGAPNTTFKQPEHSGSMWRRAWINGVDHYGAQWPETFRLVQNQGTGLLIQGTREWRNYRVCAEITPHLVRSCGIGARVQGMRRYYALLLGDTNKARLVKALDGTVVLEEKDFPWEFGHPYTLELQVQDARLQARIDGQLVFDLEDRTSPLSSGGIALLCEEGRMACDAVAVSDCRY